MIMVKAKHGGQLLRHDDGDGINSGGGGGGDDGDCDGNGSVRKNSSPSERILWLTTILLQQQ